VRQWTSPDFLRAARGRVGRPLDFRAVAARKLAAAVVAATTYAACREAAVDLALAGYRTRRLHAERAPKWS